MADTLTFAETLFAGNSHETLAGYILDDVLGDLIANAMSTAHA
jgi:hypothetical protein